MDDEMKKSENGIDRALLLATLIFPLFKIRVEEKKNAQDRSLHLGQIAECAHLTIDDIFNPFFKLPRRMRGVMGFILTCQSHPVTDKVVVDFDQK